jgi:hypothetical protein
MSEASQIQANNNGAAPLLGRLGSSILGLSLILAASIVGKPARSETQPVELAKITYRVPANLNPKIVRDPETVQVITVDGSDLELALGLTMTDAEKRHSLTQISILRSDKIYTLCESRKLDMFQSNNKLAYKDGDFIKLKSSDGAPSLGGFWEYAGPGRFFKHPVLVYAMPAAGTDENGYSVMAILNAHSYAQVRFGSIAAKKSSIETILAKSERIIRDWASASKEPLPSNGDYCDVLAKNPPPE